MSTATPVRRAAKPKTLFIMLNQENRALAA
jgi:hypothetical protein